MNFLQNNPFIRILVFWLSGILLAKFFQESIYVLLALFVFFASYGWVLYRKKQYPFDFIYSLFIACFICILSFGLSSTKKEEILPDSFQGYFKICLLEQAIEKPNSIQLNVQILQAEQSFFINKKIILYVEKDQQLKQLHAGNHLLVNCKLRKITNRGNPYEFDYAAYMARQGYYYSSYARKSKLNLLTTASNKPIYIAERFRSSLLKILKQQIKDAEAYQVIAALTLGHRKELSQEIKSRFAATGAMHVLAVSGLHVGMIYLFLSSILGFLKRKKGGQVIFVLIIGSFLWFYALLTGLSPSVQRATVMFSFILLGNSLNRPASIYNSLAASAFLLLLINSDLIFEVGFQLSYMAVLSIVFFYSRLQKLITLRYWILQKIWQLTAVSIAAQLGTFALSIYYFNQFPVYFSLSNFVVIPAAYLILGFTFLLFLLIPIETISTLIAQVLEKITRLTIDLLHQIEILPFSLIESISISQIQVYSLILIFFLLVLFIKYKRKVALFSVLFLVLTYQLSGLSEKLKLFNQQKIIHYESKNHIIHFINNRTNYLLSFNTITPEKYMYKNTICELQLNKPEIIQVQSTDSIYRADLIIQNQFILFLNKTIKQEWRTGTNQKCNLLLFNKGDFKVIPKLLCIQNDSKEASTKTSLKKDLNHYE